MHETTTRRPQAAAGSPIARRSFLGRMARFGGVGIAAGMALDRAIATGAEPASKEEPSSGVPAVQTTAKGGGGRGATQHAGGEIQEYKDDETGARVRRLTADGSDNVHLYFTSQSFLADGSSRVVFASNRSGRFQYHLLDIPAGRLVQVTGGDEVSPNMACLCPAGRLFYFDGPVLRAVKLDTLEDRELYRVPEGTRPALPTCTADGKAGAEVGGAVEDLLARDAGLGVHGLGVHGKDVVGGGLGRNRVRGGQQVAAAVAGHPVDQPPRRPAPAAKRRARAVWGSWLRSEPCGELACWSPGFSRFGQVTPRTAAPPKGGTPTRCLADLGRTCKDHPSRARRRSALGEGLLTSPAKRPEVSTILASGDLRSEMCGVRRPAHNAQHIAQGLRAVVAVLIRWG